MSSEPVIDQEELFTRMSGDVELLREVIELFKEEYPPLLTDIEVALMQGDAIMLQNAAHTLKGAVAVFSGKSVYEAALKLELMGRNDDLTGGREVYETLKSELNRLIIALTSLDLRRAS